MHNKRQITKDLCWIGTNDRRLALFENVYPIPTGVSFNSYLMTDEKTVLFDTVDKCMSHQFFDNLECALAGRKLDYVIVNHMEPDHSATLPDLLLRYPDVKIVGNAKTFMLMKQFFQKDMEQNLVTVKDGDTLNTGRHTLKFIFAPMVHWPEVMVTYDETDGTLFSADAFGGFGALNGNIFTDEIDFDESNWENMRRYYTNIVGKYGMSVMSLLNKASSLKINQICPLHGMIWRKNIDLLIEKYKKWASYEPEEKGVTIVYGSIYGNTENAAEILAGMLAEKGIRNIQMFDVSAVHPSYILSSCFRYSHIVLAANTYNAGMFVNMETFMHCLAAHSLKNRNISIIENGSWAPMSGRKIKEILDSMKDIKTIGELVTITSSIKDTEFKKIEQLASDIVSDIQV
ncbi:MAG: FprA family A-type flavoprotein [Spirochaetales bacterium]|nr:FprA family A-type flavoprotein [Spirochaetales bacterium]